MTEFKIGDIVRMTKGEPDRPGYKCEVREVSYDHAVPGEIGPSWLSSYENSGWTVELIERPLQTKPNTLGWVTVDGTRRFARLSAGGTWNFYDERGFAYVIDGEDLPDFTEAALIPRKLADKVMEWADDDHPRGWYTVSILQQIADHLKGQDDE